MNTINRKISTRARAGASTRLGFALEDLCREILAANNWKVDDYDPSSDIGIDITATAPNGTDQVVFEVKFTRNSLYPTPALRISAERLVEMAALVGAKKAVLIVAADIKPEIQKKVEEQYSIQIINLDGLLTLASVDLELLGKLVKLREIDLSERTLKSSVQKVINPKIFEYRESSGPATKNEETGVAYIERLDSIPLGKSGCHDFEDTSVEILQYLFGEDLAGWHKQKRTTDDLHRYDLICRVIDKSTVWKFVSNNLDSRYVLFEFKNYKDEIDQSQIYSTEKYLYEKAKRKVCFLISRKGPSKNAKIACAGAMREHGKLIVNLDDDVIKEFINSKISGDDPNELLFEKVDKFLMELPR